MKCTLLPFFEWAYSAHPLIPLSPCSTEKTHNGLWLWMAAQWYCGLWAQSFHNPSHRRCWTRTWLNSVIRFNIDVLEKFDFVLIQFGLGSESWRDLSLGFEVPHIHRNTPREYKSEINHISVTFFPDWLFINSCVGKGRHQVSSPFDIRKTDQHCNCRGRK